ncbi:hypothetical protein EN788_43735, partial [Mesorhizobium sp. M2D.F.Ca.ET.145.01.1.1]
MHDGQDVAGVDAADRPAVEQRAAEIEIPVLDERGITFVQDAVTKKNYKKLLTPLLTNGGGQGFCVNLSVDTSSLE